MKIVIISDIHDNTVNLRKVLDYCKNNTIEKIICCGDLAALETLDFLNENFSGEILYTFGNMDNDHIKDYPFEDNQYKNTKIFKDFGEGKVEHKTFAFVHFPEMAKKLCQSGKYNFVFYGHTHKPWEENIKSCKMLNPGNVTGTFYPATFAVWNTENDEFKLIRIQDIH